MGANEDIEKRIETIRTRSSNEAARVQAKEADARQRAADRQQRIREIRSLASQFALWAAKNKIPTEKATLWKPHRRRLGDMVRSNRPVVDPVKKSGVWKLAGSTGYSPAKEGTHYGITLYVDRKARLYESGAEPLTDQQLDAKDPGRFQPGDIHQRIAELCVEHGLEWG
jgi:hypothetical protein